MKFVFNDGGRAEAGYKGTTGDCVCRAIAIATEKPYQEIYDLINEFGRREKITKNKTSKSNARTGVYKDTIRKIMEHLGWVWKPTMQIGQGCKVHLRDGELPMGRLVVSVSGHETAVIDGVINDTYDCSRDGNRCVYGYFVKEVISFKDYIKKKYNLSNLGFQRCTESKRIEIVNEYIDKYGTSKLI